MAALVPIPCITAHHVPFTVLASLGGLTSNLVIWPNEAVVITCSSPNSLFKPTMLLTVK
jgi:hypothetical protein